MVGMSNCHVDWRTTRSAARTSREISAFVSYRAAVKGFAWCALSTCQSRHSWRWKPQCGTRNDNFFFCVSAATTAYNSRLNPSRNTCRTWSGVKIHIRQFSCLSVHQWSYLACYIRTHLSKRHRLSVSRLLVLFIRLKVLLLRNKRKRK